MPRTGAEATTGLVPWDELLAALGVESRIIAEYQELGFTATGRQGVSAEDAARLARALRLARELELHAAGAALLVELLEERERLLRRVRSLERFAGWSA